MIQLLIQKSGEGANAFFRRIELAVLLLLEDVPIQAFDEGEDLYKGIMERDITMHFMNGVHADLIFLMNSGDLRGPP